MKKNKILTSIVTLTILMLLTSCGNANKQPTTSQKSGFDDSLTESDSLSDIATSETSQSNPVLSASDIGTSNDDETSVYSEVKSSTVSSSTSNSNSGIVSASATPIPATISNFDKWTNNNFWETGIIYNETVVLYQETGKESCGYLMFSPTQLVSVTSYDLKTTYQQNKDFQIVGNKITLTNNTRINVLTEEEYFPTGDAPIRSGPWRTGGGNILYMEDAFLVNHQICVTYKYDKALWEGPIPKIETTRLSKTIAKVKAKTDIRLAIIGDSIGTGCNASSFLKIQPFMPPWFALFGQKLEKTYGIDVTLDNYSKGGQTSEYGISQASSASNKNPDLVIIEYGMNDGTYKMSTDIYINNILSIIEMIRIKNPDCEFILCASLLANPDSIQAGTQEMYITALNSLSETMTGVAVADFTGINKAMLVNNKRYADFSANNINHPNDFMQTVMASCLIHLVQ